MYLSNVGSPSVPFTVSRYHKEARCFDSLPDSLYLRGLFNQGICDVLMDDSILLKGLWGQILHGYPGMNTSGEPST